MDNGQEREFRVFILSLAESLTDTETNKLVYISELPKEYKDKQPLIVLESMHNRGLFSASKTNNLAKFLKDIKRVDLSRTVDKYAKKTKKAGAKSRATSLEPPEADPSLAASLEATLGVLSIQSKITADVMDQVMRSPQRLNELEAGAKRKAAEDLHRLTRGARLLQRQLIAQPHPAGQRFEQGVFDQGAEENDDIYSVPHFDDGASVHSSDSKSSSPDYTYVEPLELQQLQASATLTKPAAQMVTGLSAARGGTKQEKPATLPKPSKTRTEGATYSVSPRVNPHSVPQKPPVIAVTDLQKKKLTLRRSGDARQPGGCPQSSVRTSTSFSSTESSDSTGGSSYTGEDATGNTDSGFADSKSFLKVPVGRGSKQSLQPTVLGNGGESTYYKTLGTPDSLDGYTTVIRDSREGIIIAEGFSSWLIKYYIT
jgi:hypothetical protein